MSAPIGCALPEQHVPARSVLPDMQAAWLDGLSARKHVENCPRLHPLICDPALPGRCAPIFFLWTTTLVLVATDGPGIAGLAVSAGG